jgi:RsiW-degrading membrane proteinase PrsW (M82 family)
MSLTSDQIGGIVRAVVSAIGGYFVGKGVIDASTATAVAGAAVTIATAIWSVYNKKAAA